MLFHGLSAKIPKRIVLAVAIHYEYCALLYDSHAILRRSAKSGPAPHSRAPSDVCNRDPVQNFQHFVII